MPQTCIRYLLAHQLLWQSFTTITTLFDSPDKYNDMKDNEKPPKRMKRQSNRIKEIRNNIMCKQADIQEFQKKMMATPAAPPGTEGTSASDSAERAADGTGGSSPPAEQDPDYSTDDEDL